MTIEDQLPGNDPQDGKKPEPTLDERKLAVELQALKPAPTLGGEFVKGVKSGIDTLQGSAYGLAGLAGDALKLKGVRDWGLEGYKRNMEEAQDNAPAVGSYDDIGSIRDAALYASQGLGNLAPSMASSIVSGGLGALGTREVARRMLPAAADAAVKQAAERGAIAGLAANTMGTEAGGIYGDIYEKTGQHAPGTAATFGAVAGALDVLPQAHLAQKVFNPVAEAGRAGILPALGRIGREAGKQALEEGATEAAQTYVENRAVQSIDPTQDALSPEAIKDTINSGLIGAIGGGVTGGAGKTYTQVFGKDQPAPTTDTGTDTQPAANPLAPAPAAPAAAAASPMPPAPPAAAAPSTPIPPAPPLDPNAGPLTRAATIATAQQSPEPGRQFPYSSQEAAQRAANALTNSPNNLDGRIFAAAPHPTVAGRWAAIDQAVLDQQAAQQKAAEQQAAPPQKNKKPAPTAFATPQEAQALLASMPDRDQFAVVEGDDGFVIAPKGPQADAAGKPPAPATFAVGDTVNASVGNGSIYNAQIIGLTDDGTAAYLSAYPTRAVPLENLTPAAAPTNAGAHKVTPETVAPKNEVDLAAHEAANSPLNDRTPSTEAQHAADNYKVGRVTLHGMNIGVENPKGSERSGTDTDGRPWKTVMTAHYGRFTGTEGADSTPAKKQGVDVFIGDKPESTKAFVIDQIDPKTGRFDEHKVVLGTDSAEEARALYRDNYQHDWTGDHAITEVPVDQLKGWLASDGTQKPFNADAFEQKAGGTVSQDSRGRPVTKPVTHWLAKRDASSPNVAQLPETSNAFETPESFNAADSLPTDDDYEAMFEQAAGEVAAGQGSDAGMPASDGETNHLESKAVEPPAAEREYWIEKVKGNKLILKSDDGHVITDEAGKPRLFSKFPGAQEWAQANGVTLGNPNRGMHRLSDPDTPLTPEEQFNYDRLKSWGYTDDNLPLHFMWGRPTDRMPVTESETIKRGPVEIEIQLTHAPNGKWAVHPRVHAPTWGSSSGTHVGQTPFNSREEALLAGLNALAEGAPVARYSQNQSDAVKKHVASAFAAAAKMRDELAAKHAAPADTQKPPARDGDAPAEVQRDIIDADQTSNPAEPTVVDQEALDAIMQRIAAGEKIEVNGHALWIDDGDAGWQLNHQIGASVITRTLPGGFGPSTKESVLPMARARVEEQLAVLARGQARVDAFPFKQGDVLVQRAGLHERDQRAMPKTITLIGEPTPAGVQIEYKERGKTWKPKYGLNAITEYYEKAPATQAPADSATPAKVDYPNRKLGMRHAATDPADAYNDHAWANIAAANMQQGDSFTLAGKKMTVHSVTDKQLKLVGEDGRPRVFSPSGVSWAQLVRDLGGQLTVENLQAKNIMKPARPLVDILQRDPAVHVDDNGSLYLRDGGEVRAKDEVQITETPQKGTFAVTLDDPKRGKLILAQFVRDRDGRATDIEYFIDGKGFKDAKELRERARAAIDATGIKARVDDALPEYPEDNDFEDAPGSATYNRRVLARALAWGFTRDTVPRDEYRRPKAVFPNHETALDYSNGKGFGNKQHLSFSVVVAQGPNGKWAESIGFQQGTGGSSSVPGVFDDMHDTRDAAIAAGVASLRTRLNEASQKVLDREYAKIKPAAQDTTGPDETYRISERDDGKFIIENDEAILGGNGDASPRTFDSADAARAWAKANDITLAAAPLPNGQYGTVDQPLRFLSGMSRPGDFTKAFAANRHIGITIGELSGVSLPRLAQALAETRDAYLFVDSGAFSLHRAVQRAKEKGTTVDVETGLPEGIKPLDFETIMRRYEELADAIGRADDSGFSNERVLFAMPDVVANQAESLALVNEYGALIKQWGIAALVPLQSGELTLTQAYESMMLSLARDPDRDPSPVIGIPTAQAAASNEELTDLLKKHGDRIMGVHILGAAAESRLKPRLDAIRAAGYDGNVSADATVIRSLLNGDRGAALRAILAGATERAHVKTADEAAADKPGDAAPAERDYLQRREQVVHFDSKRSGKDQFSLSIEVAPVKDEWTYGFEYKAGGTTDTGHSGHVSARADGPRFTTRDQAIIAAFRALDDKRTNNEKNLGLSNSKLWGWIDRAQREYWDAVKTAKNADNAAALQKKSGFATPEQEEQRIVLLRQLANARRSGAAKAVENAQKALRKLPAGHLTEQGAQALPAVKQGERYIDSQAYAELLKRSAHLLEGKTADDIDQVVAQATRSAYATAGEAALTREHFEQALLAQDKANNTGKKKLAAAKARPVPLNETLAALRTEAAAQWREYARRAQEFNSSAVRGPQIDPYMHALALSTMIDAIELGNGVDEAVKQAKTRLLYANSDWNSGRLYKEWRESADFAPVIDAAAARLREAMDPAALDKPLPDGIVRSGEQLKTSSGRVVTVPKFTGTPRPITDDAFNAWLIKEARAEAEATPESAYHPGNAWSKFLYEQVNEKAPDRSDRTMLDNILWGSRGGPKAEHRVAAAAAADQKGKDTKKKPADTTERFPQKNGLERAAAIRAAIDAVLDADALLVQQANPQTNRAADFRDVYKAAFEKAFVDMVDDLPHEDVLRIQGNLADPRFAARAAEKFTAKHYRNGETAPAPANAKRLADLQARVANLRTELEAAADKSKWLVEARLQKAEQELADYLRTQSAAPGEAAATPAAGSDYPLARDEFMEALRNAGKVAYGEAQFELKHAGRQGFGRMQADTYVVNATFPTFNTVIGSGAHLSQEQALEAAANRAYDWWKNDRAKDIAFAQKRDKLVRAGQRELYGVFAKDAALTKAATNEIAGNFASLATKAVKEWVAAQQAEAGTDADRKLMLNNMVVDGRVTLPKEWFESLQKYLKRAARRAEQELNRDPAVYQAALIAAAQQVALPPDHIAVFRLGWDHAVAGNTKSTLPPSTQMAQGYEAAQAWLKTDAGRVWFDGRRGKKLENTGAELRRWHDGARQKIDAVTPDNLDDSYAIIKEQTSRAAAFAGLAADSATHGTRRYINGVRDAIIPFQEWLLTKGPLQNLWGTRPWRATDTQKVDAFLTGDSYGDKVTIDGVVKYDGKDATPAERLWLLQHAAREYLDAIAPLTDALRGATTINDAVDRLEKLMVTDPSKPGSWSNRLIRLTDTGKTLYPYFRKNQYWLHEADSYKVERALKVEDKPDDEVINKKQPLIVPKLDRVERDGQPDYRKGKNVTPQQMKGTFGFADVGFGKWVGAKQDQDHLNYAYDAFMDLATFLKIPPKAIGLGGTLHFTIGALGHGKFAAHFQPMHPHPDGGNVPVMNLTNTRGDGTVAHEWFHALDHALSIGWTTEGRGESSVKVWVQHGAVQQLLRILTKAYDYEAIAKRVPDFLGNGSFMRRGKSQRPTHNLKTDDGLIDNASDYIDWQRGSSRPTDYKREADRMGEDYWGNKRELFARAAEAYVLDGMEGGNNYLVNPEWVGEGNIKAPQYRGAPYPMGAERTLFAEAFDALVNALRADDDGKLTVDMAAFKAAVPDLETEFNAALDALKADLPNMLNQVRAAKRAADLAHQHAEQAKAQAAAKEAEQARIKEALEKAQQQAAEPPTGELSDTDLDALFDQAADELAEQQQEQPDAPAPGEPTATLSEQWTRDDIEFLLRSWDAGTVFLLADNSLGLPTIHDMPSNATRHMGFGTFQTLTDRYEAIWSGGGDMQRTPGGQAFTTVQIKNGRGNFLTDIDWEGARTKLQAKLIVKTGPKAAPSLSAAQEKTAAGLIADAAKLGVKGIDEALQGLVKLFGGNSLKSFPSGFDEDSYRAAKPHFEAALQAFQAAGKSLVDLFKFLIEKFGMGIKPYAIAFAKEKGLTAQLAAKPSASHQIAEWVRTKLVDGPFTSKQLFEMADDAFGGTQAEGKYSVKDAYDAMEAGVNRYILASRIAPVGSATDAQAAIEQLTRIINRLPTQTRRTSEMDEFQQFSTPPHLAYVAAWVANIHGGEQMLEPSAGIGGLAVYAQAAGARVVVNELSSRRAALLKEVLPEATLFTENAEQLHNVLPDDIAPTVIVMNPPFSATAGRMAGTRDTDNGAQHIEQALKRLAPGGRLVAIVGNGMAHDRPAFKAWWKGISAAYNVKANIGIDGANYAKYGTTFDNQLLVIDKTGPTTGAVLTARVDALDALPALLEGIRNERQAPSESGATGQSTAAEPGGNDVSGQPADGTGGAGADAVGAGQRDHDPAAGAGLAGHGTDAPADQRDGAVGPAAGDGVPDQSGKPGGGNRAGRGTTGGDGGRAGRGEPAAGQPVPRDHGQPAVTGLAVEAADAVRADGELSDAIFEQYTPQRLAIPGARPHPGKLVQSAAMAAVLPPAPTYTPNLPREVITKGLLSLAQLESVVYAGQAHAQLLPNGERRGFFIGDGTGVGKGREIAGILLDNWRAGRKKAVWVSAKQGLLKDAKRDFAGVSGNPALIMPHKNIKADAKIALKDAVVFTTYDTLRSGQKAAQQHAAQGGWAKPGTKAPKTRLDQIVDWLGEDFDGVIAFDEAHKMGNAQEKKGKRGKSKPSQVALAGIDLQKRLPKARIVYVSATGATEVSNLAYATRLGLWGEGAAFANPEKFIGAIESGGVAAMELVSRDMKAMGAYLARSLSFDGVTYDRLEHPLTPLQTDIYNELAKAWQIVLQNINAALETTKQAKDGNAKSAALSQFWGSHQRFFNQVVTSMQMPAIVDAAKADLAAGHAVVMQLVNTNEAEQERQAARIASDDDAVLEDLDFTPRQTLIGYVSNAFPVRQYEEYIDDDGNTQVRPVSDSKGNPVFNKDMEAKRDALLKTLEQIRVPDNPIDMILNAFGPKAVAEITGRKRRFVQEKGNDGRYRVVEQRRPASAVVADAEGFMDDDKQLLVFSDAGGTGYSFQSDLTRKNQRRRIHYLVQPGWRANNAVQGFGRTHRSNEANQPHYVLATTDLPAQKRFISSIARRLDQLGALTKGQRETGSQGMFSATDNLESQYAADALDTFLNDMYRGASPLNFHETTTAMGLTGLIDQHTGALNRSKLPQIPQFLNRLLSLTTDMQDKVFGEFFKTLEEVIARAKANGTYEAGVETLRALAIRKVRDEVVHTDARTGAETRYVQLELDYPTQFNDFDDTDRYNATRFDGTPNVNYLGFYRNEKTGRVFALTKTGTSTNDKGELFTRGRRDHPTGMSRYVDDVDRVLQAIHGQHKIDRKEMGRVYEGSTLTALYTPPGATMRREYDGELRRLLEAEGEAAVEQFLASPVLAATPERQAALKNIWEQMQPLLVEKEVTRKVNAFSKLTEKEARAAWKAEQDATPKVTTEEEHLITGMLLPIWDRLEGDPRVVRTQTDDGERLLGRVLSRGTLRQTLKNLGVGSDLSKMPAAKVIERILAGDTALLANGWEIKKVRVSHDTRLEITGVGLAHSAADRAVLQQQGAFSERIAWQERVFLPTGEKAAEVLARVLSNKPLVDLINAKQDADSDAAHSLAPQDGPGMAADAVQDVVDPIVASWRNAPRVTVVQTVAELPFSAPANARGAYYQGRVWLVADNLHHDGDVQFVLAHEALGHAGLDALLEPAERTREMNRLRLINPALAKAATRIAADRGVPIEAATEEALADMAGAGATINGLQKLVARVQDILRALGLEAVADWIERHSHAETLRLLTRAKEAIEGRRAPRVFDGATDAAPALSQSAMKNIDQNIRRGEKAMHHVLLDKTTAHRAMYRNGLGWVDFEWGDSKKGIAHILQQRMQADGMTQAQVERFLTKALVETIARGTVQQHAEVNRVQRQRISYGNNIAVLVKSPASNAWVLTGFEERPAGGQGGLFVPAPPTQDAPTLTRRDLGADGTAIVDPSTPPKFSLDKQVVRRMGDAVKNVSVTDVKQSFGNRLTDLRPLGLTTLGRRQIMDIYGKLFAIDGQRDLLQQYNDLVMKMDADKNAAGAHADGIADRWGKLADARALAELMHDATRYEIDPDKPYRPGDIEEVYKALRARFDALSAPAKGIYREARAAYHDHWKAVRAAVRERILRALPNHPRRAQLLARMDAELFAPVKGVYFPLARFGDYMIRVSDENGRDGEAVHFAETMAEAEHVRRQLLTLYPADKGYVVSKVTKRREFNAARDAVGRGFLQELFGVLDQQGVSDDLQDAISQLYLVSLPDLSWAKHGIHRKNTPGFSQDARRAFAHNIFHGARYLAKLTYADQMADRLDAMQETVNERAQQPDYDPVAAQQVVDEMVKRHDLYLNPNTNKLSTMLTSAGFVFYLGGSLASAAVNLSQTALVGLPILGGRYGFGRASAALLKASNDAMRGHNDLAKTLTGDERALIEQAIDAGVIDVSMAHDLAGIAQGEDAKLFGKLRGTMKAASFLFHHAERFNRQATILAAYRLARDAGMTHQQAYDAAVTDTYAAHFDYSAGNRPRIMQGNVARVLLLFKQYAQNMIYTMARNFVQAVKGDRQALKTLSALIGMHIAAAGILGLPIVGPVLGALSMLGSDDDEPWDAEVALRNWLAEAFGNEVGEVVSHGLSRLTPWDISGRVGLDKLIFPDVREGLHGQEHAEAWLSAAIGPVGSMGTNAAKGLDLIFGKGDLYRGLEAMLPAALRAPVRALRFANEGAMDRTGIEILPDVSPAEIAGQVFGFAPSRVREATEGKGAIHDAARALTERRQELLTAFAKAAMADDAEGRAQAQEQIAHFNSLHPQMAIRPLHLAQSIRQRLQHQQRAEQGVYLPRSLNEAREAGRFAKDDNQ